VDGGITVVCEACHHGFCHLHLLGFHASGFIKSSRAEHHTGKSHSTRFSARVDIVTPEEDAHTYLAHDYRAAPFALACSISVTRIAIRCHIARSSPCEERYGLLFRCLVNEAMRLDLASLRLAVLITHDRETGQPLDSTAKKSPRQHFRLFRVTTPGEN